MVSKRSTRVSQSRTMNSKWYSAANPTKSLMVTTIHLCIFSISTNNCHRGFLRSYNSCHIKRSPKQCEASQERQAHPPLQRWRRQRSRHARLGRNHHSHSQLLRSPRPADLRMGYPTDTRQQPSPKTTLRVAEEALLGKAQRGPMG
jgi:hypothetical protein